MSNAPRILALALTAALGGCMFAASPPETAGGHGGGGTTNSGSAVSRVGLLQPELVAGVVVLDAACNPSTRETWNGLDDDCDAQIDEDFVVAGPIQITLHWQTEADIDLSVVDPRGNVVSWKSPRSPTGGFLDRDARGACAGGETETGENIVWATPTPPFGQYHVVLDYFEDCRGAGRTPVVFSVSVDGRLVGAYQYPIDPGAHAVTVATFGVP